MLLSAVVVYKQVQAMCTVTHTCCYQDGKKATKVFGTFKLTHVRPREGAPRAGGWPRSQHGLDRFSWCQLRFKFFPGQAKRAQPLASYSRGRGAMLMEDGLFEQVGGRCKLKSSAPVSCLKGDIVAALSEVTICACVFLVAPEPLKVKIRKMLGLSKKYFVAAMALLAFA